MVQEMVTGSIAAGEPSEAAPQRLVSLDVFRGATIAYMIFVNSLVHESGLHLGPFAHGGWGKATPTDWVFPFFLFIMGVTMPFSFERRLAAPGGRRALWRQIIKRTVLLFLIGWLLHLTPGFKWRELRILGTLQRIGLCYFFTSLLVLYCGRRSRVAAVALLLLGYWALMAWVPFPGKGGTWEEGTKTQAMNLVQFIDRAVLGVHLQSPYRFESKGILSTLPAIANTLVGFLCGAWLRSRRRPLELTNGLFVWGSILVVLAFFWYDFGVPFFQGLWTCSFAVLTSGLAMLLLAVCIWRIDIQGRSLANRFFTIFGVNAILIYAGHQALGRTLSLTGKPSLQWQLYHEWLAPWAGMLGGSVIYALAMVAFWWAVCALLYRWRIILKL